ncbi:MAG: lipoyl(octanoyl) transferase LipB [Lentisphaerae bacterium]|nr:lipoyl(octanoyl) transferase LipB [Lentisphaerota bacterium]
MKTVEHRAVLDVRDLGRRAYRPVLSLQEELAVRRRAGRIGDTLILVEHEPVYTLGRSARAEHLLLTPEACAQRGIDVVPVGRGGDVTYHGPGQLVGYPILDLGRRARAMGWYVGRLEAVLLNVLADFDVRGKRDARNRGVWIGNDKVAAIGVRIARGITMHGFALNVRTDEAPYAGIVPCGLRGAGITSLHRRVPEITLEAVKPRVVQRFRECFGYDTGSEADAG